MKHLTSNILEAHDLSCLRGDNLLFENLNFCVESGEVHQIHGVNGAGKTSLLRIICGLSLPESGHLTWNNEDIDETRETYCSSLTYVGHQNGIKAELSALENLNADAAIHGAKDNQNPMDILDKVGLYGYEDIPTRNLSAGQKRRVAIARLFLSTAELWILDEPATALDVKGVAEFQKLVENHAVNGGMAIITSHQELEFGTVETRRITL